MNWAIINTNAHFGFDPEPPETNLERWHHTKHRHPWLVAEDDRASIIAYAKSYDYNPREGYRWSCEVSVYVHPDHHGKGIAKVLYNDLITELEQRGFRTLVARIALPNEPSIRLHKSAGFTDAGLLKAIGHKQGRWHDTAILTKHLGSGPPAESKPAPIT